MFDFCAGYWWDPTTGPDVAVIKRIPVLLQANLGLSVHKPSLRRTVKILYAYSTLRYRKLWCVVTEIKWSKADNRQPYVTSMFFWDLTACSLVVRFQHIHLQGKHHEGERSTLLQNVDTYLPSYTTVISISSTGWKSNCICINKYIFDRDSKYNNYATLSTTLWRHMGGVNIQFHAFLTWAPHGNGQPAAHFGYFTLWKEPSVPSRHKNSWSVYGCKNPKASLQPVSSHHTVLHGCQLQTKAG